MISPSNSSIEYGAVDRFEPVEGSEEREYEIGQSYYLKSTAAENNKKCLKATGPVLIFMSIMLILAYVISQNFGHFYPGHGDSAFDHSPTNTVLSPPSSSDVTGHDDSIATGIVPSDTSAMGDSSSDTLISSHKSSSSLSSPLCSKIRKCAELNLTGHCCPTEDGEYLDCCK